MAAEVLDGAVVRCWFQLAADALGEASAAIDGLNVFPVPDADTGTNLHRTVACAAEAVAALPEPASVAQLWQAATQAALTGASGNSGIILSQLLRGLAEICAAAAPCDGDALTGAFANAAMLARAAVRHPVEGTVLTVADAAAHAARGLTGLTGLAEVATAAAAGARQALEGTTHQLAVLAASGVVDAGGAGLCVLLDALSAAVGGPVAWPARDLMPVFDVLSGLEAATGPDAARSLAVPAAGQALNAYEVMFLLESEAAEVGNLAELLDELGDSLVISGGDGQWHVHVHAADAGAVIERALDAGRPRRITVSHLAGTPAAGALAGPPPTGPASHRAVVIAEGEALAGLLSRAGGLAVPIASPVQAVAAVAVHDPHREPAADAAAMASAAAAMRYGSVEPGPVLTGRVGGRIVAEGQAAAEVAGAVAAALLGPDTELVTVILGAAADPGLAEVVAARARAASPQAEVFCYDGGMTSAILLIGAE